MTQLFPTKKLVAVAAVALTAAAMEDHQEEGGVFLPPTMPPLKLSERVRET